MPTPHHHEDPFPRLPVDSDVTRDTDVAPPWLHGRVVAAVALGGALGALARWGVGELLPHSANGFPSATLVINVAGCFLIGVVMVLVVERWPGQPLLRPFLGTGILGGFTTFSTYVVDVRTLLADGRPAVAAAYLVGTLLLGLLAVVAGLRLTERVLR